MRIEHWLYSVPLRLKSLFRRARVEQDLDEELQYHLDRKAEEFAAQGIPREQARREALRSMDGLTQRKEECRDTRRVDVIETTVRDIRYSLRVLAKSPGFTIVAVLTLAMAIGANSVVFAVLNAFILRPLDVPHAESLYGLERVGDSGYESYPNYVDFRDRNRSFESLAAYNITQVSLDTGDKALRAWVYETSGNYFDALEVRPYLGSFFHAADEHGPNSAPYIVLSHSYWHNHFADDRGVVGRTVRVNKHPFTILGVAPPGFHGTLLVFTPDFYVPIVNTGQVNGQDDLNARNRRWVFLVMGHLKPGVTPAQATADLDSIGAWLEKTYPKDVARMKFSLQRPSLYGSFLGGPVRAFVSALMLLAGLILLAACANLGSLFAARASDRGREVALRLALGASRNRILRQLFTEAVLISICGGLVGLSGSIVLLRGLSTWQPFSRFPLSLPVSPDTLVYAVSAALALVSGLLFGLVPVRQVLRTDPYQIVKAGSTATLGRRITVRDLLLVVQIAICGVLVTSSMVAVRGLARSMHSNFGIQPQNAMLISTTLNMAGYRDDQAPAMQKRMIQAMEAIPGVETAALVDYPPLAMYGSRSTIYADTTMDLRPVNAAAEPYTYRVSPRYFAAAGTTMLAGREVSWHDDASAPPVAVVNRQFADRMFGSVNQAQGRYFKRRNGTRVQVIGVVEDGKYLNLSEEQKPAIFYSILEMPSTESWMVLRTNRDPQQVAPAMKTALRNLDSGLSYYMQTWNKEMDGVLFPTRMATVALGVLGALGAMLSITGIFGMAAYSVSKRLRELGIRMALGAQRREVLQAGVGRAVKLLALGSAAGLALGILSARVLASIVYHATPRDPVVLGGVVLVMALLGLLATWIPAQRALSLDPMRLLREE